MALNYGKRFKNQRTYIIGDMTPRNKNIGTMVAYKDLLISMPGPRQPSLDSFPEGIMWRQTQVHYNFFDTDQYLAFKASQGRELLQSGFFGCRRSRIALAVTSTEIYRNTTNGDFAGMSISQPNEDAISQHFLLIGLDGRFSHSLSALLELDAIKQALIYGHKNQLLLLIMRS